MLAIRIAFVLAAVLSAFVVRPASADDARRFGRCMALAQVYERYVAKQGGIVSLTIPVTVSVAIERCRDRRSAIGLSTIEQALRDHGFDVAPVGD